MWDVKKDDELNVCCTSFVDIGMDHLITHEGYPIRFVNNSITDEILDS